MILVGLTGSIGMGKSTVGQMFAELGAAYWDADSAVHRLYARGGAGVDPVGEAFPAAIVGNSVDRAALAEVVLKDADKLAILEAIVHPLVAQDRENFLAQAIAENVAMAVLDIPLLFENNAQALFHEIVVVSAPSDIQRARVLARPGMSEDKLNAILAQQIPDEEKRKRADHIIETGQPLEDTKADVARVYAAIVQKHSTI